MFSVGRRGKGGALPGGNVLQKSISTSTVLQANSSTIPPHFGGLNGSGINNSPKVLTSKTRRKKKISSELKNKAMSLPLLGGGEGGQNRTRDGRHREGLLRLTFKTEDHGKSGRQMAAQPSLSTQNCRNNLVSVECTGPQDSRVGSFRVQRAPLSPRNEITVSDSPQLT